MFEESAVLTRVMSSEKAAAANKPPAVVGLIFYVFDFQKLPSNLNQVISNFEFRNICGKLWSPSNCASQTTEVSNSERQNVRVTDGSSYFGWYHLTLQTLQISLRHLLAAGWLPHFPRLLANTESSTFRLKSHITAVSKSKRHHK